MFAIVANDSDPCLHKDTLGLMQNSERVPDTRLWNFYLNGNFTDGFPFELDGR